MNALSARRASRIKSDPDYLDKPPMPKCAKHEYYVTVSQYGTLRHWPSGRPCGNSKLLQPKEEDSADSQRSAP